MAPTQTAKSRSTKPKTRRRQQGRPSGDGDSVGKDGLLRAVRDLMRHQPPSKINRLEIARHAGVDPGLVRYYFGDTDALFAAVVVDITAEARRVLSERASATTREQNFSLKSALRDRIRGTLRMFKDNPHQHELIVDHIFSGKNPAARNEWRTIISQSVAELDAMLRLGEKSGDFRYVEPRYLHMLIISACEFFFSGNALIEDMFESGSKAANDTEAFGDFLADIITNGLRAS